MTPARLADFAQLVAKKATFHPELNRPLTFAGFKRIAAREQLELLVSPHPRLAELIPVLGRWTIIIDRAQPKAAWPVCGAHELAHLWLHHDPFFDRAETSVYDGSPPWYDAVREEEADAFAELLVRGPVPVTSPIARRKKENRPTEQLPLELPEPLPAPFQAERDYERGVRARGGKTLRPKSPKGSRIFRDVPTSDDEQRIKWHDETKGTTRFEDVAGRRWWIYNFRKTPTGWERITDFMLPAITHRLFVNSAGARRLYQFGDGREQRAYRVKHLDRQISQARALPAKERKPGSRVETFKPC